MSRTCDVTRGMDHVVRLTRPSGSVLHTASKNWSQGRPGNEAMLIACWSIPRGNKAMINTSICVCLCVSVCVPVCLCPCVSQ